MFDAGEGDEAAGWVDGGRGFGGGEGGWGQGGEFEAGGKGRWRGVVGVGGWAGGEGGGGYVRCVWSGGGWGSCVCRCDGWGSRLNLELLMSKAMPTGVHCSHSERGALTGTFGA